MRYVEKKGPSISMLVDKPDRMPRNQMRRVPNFRRQFLVMPPVRIPSLINMRYKINIATQVPDEMIETMTYRVVPGIIA